MPAAAEPLIAGAIAQVRDCDAGGGVLMFGTGHACMTPIPPASKRRRVAASSDTYLFNTIRGAAVKTVAASSDRPVVHSDRGGHYRWPG